LNTSNDAIVILQVSRLDPHKGHREHLESLAQLRELPDWVCWQVAGPQRPHEYQYLEELKTLAKELGIQDRVLFWSWQADIAKFFKAADIYCQPNVGPEPFGITFVEALYDGLPVITTGMAGPLEIIDSSCGLLVPQNNPHALTEALRSLIQSRILREILSSGGPVRAEAICSPSAQLRLLCETLREMTSAISDKPGLRRRLFA